MATISITNELDVLDKYTSLVQESIGSESIYIRTKETVEDMVVKGMISNTDRATIISQVLSGINNAVVASAMQTALQWANMEKEVALKKLELAKQLDILDQEYILKQKQTNQAITADINAQAERIRAFGTPVVVDGQVVSLADEGKTYQETRLITQEVTNKGAEKLILDAKLKESNAAIHKIIADTYENYGYYNYTIGDNGVATVSKLSSHETLAANQKLIAKEQAKGYAYNAWSNAAQSSASMIGALVAAEVDGISNYVSQWSAIISQLGAITTPTTTGL